MERLVVGVELGSRGRALSHGSQLAVGEAEVLAAHFGASVTLLHSTADDESWDEETSEYVRLQPLTDEGRKALESTVEGLREESIEADLVVSDEPCVLAISRLVVKTGAELVIVGKRTQDTRDGHRLGSVARALIHDCPGDVWVVRPGRDPEHGRILAAADLTPVGERVVRTAARVAGALESELHVVHALSLPLAVQIESTTERERYLEDRGTEARKQLRAWLKDVPATTHVGLTSPTQAVLSGVEQLGPGLVVLGTISRHGIPGRIIGNTAERLLDRLDTSLLVVKPEEFESPLLT